MSNLTYYCGKAANRVIRPLGVQLVRRRAGQVDPNGLSGALCRLAENGIRPATIVDVGASDGCWSRTARTVFPDAAVLAFEPLQERWEALDAWASRESRVEIARAVAGREPGEVVIDVSADLDGSGINESPRNGRSVPVAAIDDEIRRRRMAGPYLIKLDTHGYEVPILEGAAATLGEAVAVIIEVYNFRLTGKSLLFHEMCGHMERLGFRCLDIFDVIRRPGDQVLWQADFVFIKAGHPVFRRTTYR